MDSGIKRILGFVDVPCLILVGGLGTRLRSMVPDVPKPMVRVDGKPFLEYLIRWVARMGSRRIVLCAGYRAHQVEEYFGGGDNFGVEITYSVEDQPLGTWGAIRLAEKHINAPYFLVLNGDSWLEVDLSKLFDFHCKKRAICSIAAVEVDNPSRFGSIRIDESGRVTEFVEKSKAGTSLINGGIYVFSREAMNVSPSIVNSCSLEKEVFSKMIPRGIYAMPVKGYFIDIGVPEAYKHLLLDAQNWIKTLGIRDARGG
jgi:D-glycero-alpha-D-manno-heptose 1-phosphate guanylyltransferase